MALFQVLEQTLALLQSSRTRSGHRASYLVFVPYGVRTLRPITDADAVKERDAPGSDVVAGIPRPGSVCWACSSCLQYGSYSHL